MFKKIFDLTDDGKGSKEIFRVQDFDLVPLDEGEKEKEREREREREREMGERGKRKERERGDRGE